MEPKIIPDESYLEGLDSLDPETEAVSPEEKAELESVLERMIIAPTDKHYGPMPEKEDSRLPWLVLSGALLVVGVTLLIALAGVDRSLSRLVLDPDVISSGEGRVLEKYRQESEVRIRQKDAEILNILRQMDRLERQRQSLELLTRAAIEQREQKIRDEMAAELAAERAKLRAEGLSAQEADRRIQELQAQLDNRSQEELGRLRDEADVVLTVQREEIAARQDLAQTALVRVSRERTGIVTDLELAMAEGEPAEVTTDAELPETTEGAEATETGDAEEAAEKNAELARQDLFVSSEIAGSYEGVLSLIAQSRLDRAAVELDRLREALLDPAVAELPVSAARRPSDLAMVEALRAYLAQLRLAQIAAEKPPEPEVRVEEPVVPAIGPSAPEAPPTTTPVGRIALADRDRIVVETLTGFSVPEGAVLELWRTGTTEQPLWVGHLKVVAVSGDRVVATTDGAPEREPRVFDLAYLARD
jgi:hypothetical protein